MHGASRGCAAAPGRVARRRGGTGGAWPSPHQPNMRVTRSSSTVGVPELAPPLLEAPAPGGLMPGTLLPGTGSSGGGRG
eukprot:scaffold1660_cov92-Isochrysis_galbana.AAC.1